MTIISFIRQRNKKKGENKVSWHLFSFFIKYEAKLTIIFLHFRISEQNIAFCLFVNVVLLKLCLGGLGCYNTVTT